MSRPAPPYPPNLTWRRVGPRLFILNQVLLLVGALSLHATEVLSPQQPNELGLLYYLTWLQCIGLTGLLVTANAMLLVARHGWRTMPDAPARYDRDGLYKGLPSRTKWALLVTTAVCLLAGSWMAQQLFIALQHTSWGLANLSQAYPLFKITLFNATYGTLSVYVFEYFQDRAAVSEARERRAHQLTAETQLHLLRSQLDPHMLFNTLSNLYELIDDSPQQARAMLLHMISFLRSTLNGSRATQHTLAEEFKLASDYLSLMQIRMGDRLRIALNLPETLQHAQVPAMLLQPLIENAIKHGLEQARDGGELTVAASEEAGQLSLRVRNACASGPLKPLWRAESTTEAAGGFGLRYVKERLDTLYGQAARFEMKHLRQHGVTEATIVLPLSFQQASA